MHHAADITGAEIMRTIRDEARNLFDKIQVLELSPAVELVLNEHGHCAGSVLYNIETQEYFVVKAKAVVLATGGCGRLHIQGFMTTNHCGATADGIVLGYRAGVPVSFLHTVQYHPTGIVFPEQAEAILITENFRGSGANRLMGNSLLDIIVFGRIAGTSASQFIQDGVKDGKLTLDHVVKYNAEVEKAGITDGRVAPAIIPDYTEAEVRERQLTANYVGNVR